MGTRKRKKKRSINKKKGEGSQRGKPTLPDGEDIETKKNELPPKSMKINSKKSGEQVGQACLADRKVPEDISFLKTVQNRWDRLVGYIKNQADSILKRVHVRERQGEKGSAKLAEEEGIRKKRKDQATIQDDPSEDCSGTSKKQRKITVPLTVETFSFHSVLGEGTYGKVILATDSIRNESVALKIVKKRSLIVFSQCLVENQVLRIAHKSKFLIHGYAAFHTENYGYYVTELACGGDLQQLLCENQLHMETIKFLTAEIICGLQFLHTNGIVHRDIKLDNILLTGDGHVKITDFGLALFNVCERVNATDYPGTPGYGAPEMILGQSYNGGVDWFALGVMLYAMIFRCMAFPGNTIEEIERNIVYREPSYGNVTDHATLDILSRLLFKDQSVRLGVNGNIKNHPFFSSLNWTDIETGKTLSSVAVRKNMDAYRSQREPAPCSEDLKEPIPAEEQNIFISFPFVCPAWSTSYH